MATDTHAKQKQEITGRTKRREHTHTHSHRSHDSCGGTDVTWTSGASGGASQQEEQERSSGMVVSTRNDVQEGMFVKTGLNMPECWESALSPAPPPGGDAEPRWRTNKSSCSFWAKRKGSSSAFRSNHHVYKQLFVFWWFQSTETSCRH